MPRSLAPERPSAAMGDERASRVPPAADSVRDVAQEDFLFHLYRGTELLQESRVLEAKEELEFALTMQPLDAKGQDVLAAVYFRLGLYPRAMQIYEALCEQFPRDVSVKVNLSLGLLKTGQPEKARAVLEEAVAINPEHKRAWGYLGLALQKLGEFDQAHAAFERGGRPLMAKRATEARQRSLAPPPAPPKARVELDVREIFSELDATDLRFSMAPEPHSPGDGPWQVLEIGEASGQHATAPQTVPFVSARQPDQRGAEVQGPAPPPGRPRVPSLLEALGDGGGPAIAMHPSGMLLVRTRREPARAFAGRIEAVRVVSGPATPQVLRRRARDADTAEILGGLGSPVVRFDGDAQLVFGPRSAGSIVLVGLENDLAFVREEALLGFDLSLVYENGKLALEAPGDGGPPGGEASPIVQLRGTGALALEVAGGIATVASAADRPLLVRREWIVGWVGRLMPRAVGAAEAPNGQRGLISFSGEGAVLVLVGG